MHLHRVAIAWSGGSVKGLAATVLHYDGSSQTAPPVAALKTAFDSVMGLLPLGVSLQIPGSGDTIEDTTGALTGVWSATQPSSSAGSGPAANAAGVGACISWSTGGIVNGRRLRGRTFIVPLHASCYDTDGTFTGTALNTLRSFATALQATGPLAVWHRPLPNAPGSGTSYGVLGNKVSDKVAYLSSRRD